MGLSEVIIGTPGCGKTELLKRKIVEAAERDDCAQLIVLNKETTAIALVGQLVARGLEPRVEYETLAANDGKVLPWEHLPPLQETDPVRRRNLEELQREELKQVYLARKGLVTDEDKGFTREAGDLMVATMQHQLPRKPLAHIRKVLMPATSAFEVLCDDCQDGDLVLQLRECWRLYRRSPTQFEVWAGAARRMFDPVETAVFQARCNPEPGRAFDWMRAFRQRKIIIVNGAGVARPTFRAIVLSMILQAIDCARRSLAEERRPLPIEISLEEAGANRLAVPFVLTALQESRESGISITMVNQSPRDFAEDEREKILNNTPGGHTWFKQMSAADQKIAADDLANPTWNDHLPHYTRARQVHAGTKEIHQKVRGKSKDKQTGREREDEREIVTFQPLYKDELVEYYKTPQLHHQDYMTGVALLSIGQYFLRTMDGVFKIQGEMLEEPWGFPTISERRTAEAIARIRSRAHYQTARLVEPLRAPAPPPEPSAARPTPGAQANGHSTPQPVPGSRLAGKRRRQQSSNGSSSTPAR